MIDESDPAVVAMKAQFEEISARHRESVTSTMADYEKREAENKARQDEVVRREADMLAAPPPPVEPPKNPWLTRRNSPRPARPPSDDGSDTGYYTNTWMQ
jgi:hypothetical protein